jgi:hypothetical protein
LIEVKEIQKSLQEEDNAKNPYSLSELLLLQILTEVKGLGGGIDKLSSEVRNVESVVGALNGALYFVTGILLSAHLVTLGLLWTLKSRIASIKHQA